MSEVTKPNQEQAGTPGEQPSAQPQQTRQRDKPVITPPKSAAAQPVPKGLTANMAMPRNRHDVGFRHDVFRSDTLKCLRDVGYEYLKPKLEKVDHAHIYHSHNNQGKKQSRTGSACGHWHYVEHYVDPTTGATVAKCGPAMHEVTELTQTGRTVTKITPVYFEEEVMTGADAGEVRKLMDDHKHVLEYIGSEDLSPNGIENDLKSQRALAGAMGMTVDPAAIKDNTPAPMSASDGASIS